MADKQNDSTVIHKIFALSACMVTHITLIPQNYKLCRLLTEEFTCVFIKLDGEYRQLFLVYACVAQTFPTMHAAVH